MGEQKYLGLNRFQNNLHINEVQGKKSSSEQKERVFDPVRQYKTQADSIRKQIQESPNKGKGAHAYLHNEILYITDKQAKIVEFESKGVKPITVEHALWQQEFGENTRLALDLAGVEKPLDKGMGTSEVQKSLDKPYTEWVMKKIPDHLERHDTPSGNNDCGGYGMLGGADHDMKSQKTKDLVLEMKRHLVKNGLIGSTGKMIEFGRYGTYIENITKGSGEQAFLWLRDTKHEIEAGRGLRVYGFQDHGGLIVAQDVIESDAGKEPVSIYQTGSKFKHFEALSQKVDVSSQNSRVADEGYVSDTPNGILSIRENKSRKVDAPAEPKLDELLPLNMMGSTSDHSLIELKNQILKKEKDYLEVKISLNDIYKEVEENYPKVSRESLEKINRELSILRAEDLMEKMAPNNKGSNYKQAIKDYCNKKDGEFMERVVGALERNKDYVCEKLYKDDKDRGNINMEAFINQLLEHDSKPEDAKKSELMKLHNDNASSLDAVYSNRRQVKPGNDLSHEGKVENNVYPTKKNFVDFIMEMVPESNRKAHKKDVEYLYDLLQAKEENMGELMSEVKKDRKRLVAWLSKDQNAIKKLIAQLEPESTKKLIAQLEPESTSPITDGKTLVDLETRNDYLIEGY